MTERIVDPRKQFSKKLARWTAVFWFFYMSWLSCLMMLRPEVALYTVYMGIIVTVVMIVNVWAYTRNSVYEKACFAMLDKTKIELGLKGITKTVGSTSNEETDNKEDNDDEEVLNEEEEGGNG
jgi:hypothetical protein